GAVAGINLYRSEVGRIRAADIDAQPAEAGDRPGRIPASATAAGGRVRGDVGHGHRAARTGRAGRRGAAADAVREPAAHGQVKKDGQVVVERGLSGRRAYPALGHAEVLVPVQVEGDRLGGRVRSVQDHRVRVEAALAASA